MRYKSAPLTSRLHVASSQSHHIDLPPSSTSGGIRSAIRLPAPSGNVPKLFYASENALVAARRMNLPAIIAP